MARFDKTEPHVGLFRAPLGVALTYSQRDTALAVSLNGSGQLTLGGASPLGVIIATSALPSSTAGATAIKNIGDIMDVMTAGEIVDQTVPALTAGVKVYSDAATGVLTATATANKLVGFTVEASRVVVRMAIGTLPAAT
jgi:hypothetical protein